MSYEVLIEKSAEKKLSKIPQNYKRNISDAISNLAENPRPSGCKKLKGRPAWRIRVGIYRVIYKISDRQLIVTVIDIGHRKDIYR